MKVRFKREIVTLGHLVDPSRRVGRYIEPEAWNRILDDPEVTVIDVRNRYEIHEGSFPGAVNPQTDAFREFPAFVAERMGAEKARKVAMFCTGGIRCEKATSYLLDAGFTDVVQLRGGILGYLDGVQPAESRWQGRCFVFDERGVVDS